MRFSITLISLLFSLSANASIFKWTDANGQTHFSETPASASAERVFVKPYQPSDKDIAHTRERANNVQQWVTIKQTERDIENKRIAQKERNLAASKQQCHSLKNQLIDMMKGRVRWYSLDQQGERKYLSEKEITNKRQNLKDRINGQCA